MSEEKTLAQIIEQDQPSIIIEGDITVVATTDISQFAREQADLWLQVRLCLEHLHVDDSELALRDSLIVSCSKSMQAWDSIANPTAQP
jgi:hypothetical protein